MRNELEIWRLLEAEFGKGRLATSRTWVETWLDHYGALVPHYFVLGVVERQYCAIALITESLARYGPPRITRLHFETAGEPTGQSVHVINNGLLGKPELKQTSPRRSSNC